MDNMLQMLLSHVTSTNSQLAASSESIKSINAQRQLDQEDLLKQTALQGDSQGQTAIMTEAADRAALQAQRNSARFATALGTNMDDAGEIMTTLATRWKHATLAADDAKQELEDKMSVKFADNPGQWVINQFTMGDSINKADEFSSRANNLGKSLAEAQANTQSVVATNNAISEKRTEATVQSHLQAVQASINATVDKTKIDNAGINLRGIEQLDNLSIQQLNATGTANSAIVQQQHLALAQAQFQQTKQMNALLIADRQERLDERTADRNDLAAMAASTQKGLTILGIGSGSDVPAAKVIQLIKMKDPLYLEAMHIGMNSESINRPIISDNAGDVARIINTNNAPLQPGQQNIKQLYKDAWMHAVDPANAAGKYDVTKLPAVSNEAGRLATNAALGQMSNIKTGDNTNLYAPPPLTTIVQQPAIAQSQIYTKVLGPQMQTGALKEFNPVQIRALLLPAIKSGDISYTQASYEFAALFNAARVSNNVNNNYVGAALPIQQGYTIHADNSFGFSRKYNLADVKDASNFLSSGLATTRLESSVPVTTSNF